ncbi:NADH dehydrogenase (ubiquinone), G chain [Leptospira biflexa serovar Patoc strain 'Patoc 1 (Ames)']|uniref:NADH-quinone oxidoreductase chain G n=1 Tax=Leptospira biflexa serovar Patoc (strain Patoc 1 / ATCC 23582 / Paris) TaxID=456481 RepID=B0SRH6_LEPBP|nr:2Fe-2S iron-sulfur cluster-binding protein [Leptospira biflexa]ABZ95757.1 NADH dehydrogenase (ubiquinone), G chain [Leptospira biflexa serovar Patoc strain 'Patoc 1 (Ames)']ABZ99468.1 NADH-quinone oxidoreductase chain G [Leptospira biflexa serovar Patoc strain 'Patoc 1 (Paris)']
MVKIKIDGVEYEVDEKKNLIDATKEVGVEIPYFCYHPALSIVGMCRMCLIEIEGVPRLQAACNTPVKEGMGIITKSDRVKEARAGTMEFLLANHPLDCPVCDKAGECRLQDNAFGSGTGHSRFEFEKRNIPQEEIGTNLIINHNRCIVCYRCVRFEEEKVGESNLGLFERGNHSIIGLAKSEPIDHNYQGALADICPVGALLNNKTLFKSRVWWYKSHKSVCHGCSTGCNVTTNVRDNKMYRYMVRENFDQGMFFLCDKGRFDLDWMNDNRLFSYLESGKPSTSQVVISKIIDRLKDAKSIAVLGGAHESNETLEALKQNLQTLSRELSGKSIQWETRVTDAQNKETEQVDFLLTKDYHPNTKGAVDLGLTTPSGISGIVSAVKQGSIDLVILLKESIPEGIDPTQVISLDTNLTDAAKNASLAAPIQIFCEAEGSFTNKNGLKQTFEKSMNPIQGLQTSAGVVELIVKTMTKKMEASVGNR